VGDVPVADLEDNLADLGVTVGEAVGQVPPDHPPDDPVLGHSAARRIERFDDATIANDGDRIGDRLDLLDLVGDQDRRDALGLEAAQQAEQLLAVGLVQGGRRLVEDQESDLLGEGLGDLDELLLADAESSDGRVGEVVEADHLQQVARPGMGGAPVDQAVMALFVAEEDVLGDRELGDQGELLVDDDDAERLAGPDVGELGFLPVEQDQALVLPVRIDPAEHLHEGRLARPVLADEGMDLAATHGQIDVVERLDARERLGDPPHLEENVAHPNRHPFITRSHLDQTKRVCVVVDRRTPAG